MNLLMITRKIDKDDWLAGHGYEWARDISLQLTASSSQLFVICLESGNTEGLPENVKVYSLGKETGNSRWQRFWNLQKLVVKLVPKVDGIFSHQNAEYAISVSPLAFLFHKKIVSWYTHKSVTWKTKWMLAVSKAVLTASKESFRINSPKVKVVGHGIDVEVFKATSYKLPVSTRKSIRGGPATSLKIITVGRISPVKNLETLILSTKFLRDDFEFENFEVRIVGDVGLPQHNAYRDSLIQLVKKSDLVDVVKFLPAVAHHQIHEIYQQADIFVNLSQTGSIDKAALEAMACENIVISSNEAFKDLLRPFADLCLVRPNNPKGLAKKINVISQLNESDKKALTANLRRIVVDNHSLDRLAKIIVEQFEMLNN